MRTIFLAVLFSLAACGMAVYAPATRPTQMAPEDVHTRALRVLADRGHTIAEKDEKAGLILTEWEERTVVTLPSRFRWRIQSDGGAVTVESQCQHKEDGGAWSVCGGTKQPEDRLVEQAAIADAIVK